jgi:uncharacterized membrane protein
MNLEGLPGSTFNQANGVNDAGQVVGVSIVGGVDYAVEWIVGTVINLGAPSAFSEANGINAAGLVVGESAGLTVPEPSTWAMIMLGFAGFALAGYCRAKAGRPTLASEVG